jgi:hypothetical protein
MPSADSASSPIRLTEEVVPAAAPDGTPGVLARYREMPGCQAWGRNPSHALHLLGQYREIYIQEATLSGRSLAEPAPAYAHELTLSADQASALSTACDVYSRVQAGQLAELAQGMRGRSVEAYHRTVDALRQASADASGLRVPAYHSIGSAALRDTARIAYDLHQVVRHRLAWDRNPSGGFQVTFDPPMRWSARTDLPTIRHGEDGQLVLAMTEPHAQVVSDACELYARLGMGQWEAAADAWDMGQRDPTAERLQALREQLLGLAVEATGLEPGASWGIRSEQVPQDAKRAWDLYQVVRARRGTELDEVLAPHRSPFPASGEPLPTLAPRVPTVAPGAPAPARRKR